MKNKYILIAAVVFSLSILWLVRKTNYCTIYAWEKGTDNVLTWRRYTDQSWQRSIVDKVAKFIVNNHEEGPTYGSKRSISVSQMPNNMGEILPFIQKEYEITGSSIFDYDAPQEYSVKYKGAERIMVRNKSLMIFNIKPIDGHYDKITIAIDEHGLVADACLSPIVGVKADEKDIHSRFATSWLTNR